MKTPKPTQRQKRTAEETAKPERDSTRNRREFGAALGKLVDATNRLRRRKAVAEQRAVDAGETPDVLVRAGAKPTDEQLTVMLARLVKSLDWIKNEKP